MRGLVRRILSATVILWGLGSAQAAEPVTVFAAASMNTALEEAGQVYRADTGTQIRFSFAASSTLARQIEQGAPAQIFISADEIWMDYLDKRGLIDRGSRISPVGNRLVLIAPRDSRLVPVDISSELDLAGMLGADGRLSVGDPAHVPAGTYAKQALEKLHLWDTVARRTAPAENVRAALALVERGETPLGIVYATDAAVSKHVKVLGTFPHGSHPPITYPFALLKGRDTPEARAFFAFLTGSKGKAIFRKHGFVQD